MIPNHPVRPLAILLTSLALMALISGCKVKQESPFAEPEVPYPPAEEAAFLQEMVDSSEYLWFTEPKAVASAFCNDQLPMEDAVPTDSVTILEQGLFHGMVEVHLPTRKLILTLERPFKHKGENSIWQVVKMEEKINGP
jgi:hypothetical protein